MTSKEQLYSILSELFGAPLASINSKTSRDNLENWASMGTIDLVAQLEKAFSVQFDLLEVEDLFSVGILEEALREKGIEI